MSNWYKKIAMPMKSEEDIPVGFELKKNISDDNHAIFKIQNKSGEKLAIIGIEKIEGSNSWYVSMSKIYEYPRTRNRKPISGKGFGPLLYDIAMKYVSDQGNSLMSNERAKQMYGISGATSEDANKVWKFYKNKRDDVEEYEEGYRFKEKV